MSFVVDYNNTRKRWLVKAVTSVGSQEIILFESHDYKELQEWIDANL